MSTQELILGNIERAIAVRNDVILVNDRQYGNTGTLRTYDAAMNHIASLTYEFQRDYCHFGPTAQRVAALWYGQSAEGMAPWVKGSIPELVATVTEHLLGGR